MTASINGRVTINGLGGADRFYSDDTSAMVTLDGGRGDDIFQIGQVFGTARISPFVATGDEVSTNETTLGFLSVGNSLPMVANGGLGNDTFNIYSNKALTKLFGEDGDDTFVVRAFVLKASPGVLAGGGDTELFGGGGADTVMYNLNAPLKIDGGAGVDKVVVLGTEVGDSFWITESGIYGAGLNVAFEGVELAEVDGLEGDDTFYVTSTSAKMAVTVIGGLGADVINVGADVTLDIVSAEVEGTSGIVNHSVASADLNYNEAFVDGIRLNIASAAKGLVEIDDTGLTALNEGGLGGYYMVRLIAPISATAYLTVSAARSSTQDNEGGAPAQSILVAAGSSGYASAQVLTFTSGNYGVWQRVDLTAPEDSAFEGTRKVVISHAITSTDAALVAMQVPNQEVTVFDNDRPDLLLEGNPSLVELTEGTSQTLKLRLSTQPALGETVTITPQNLGDDLTGNLATLTFTADNWNVAQDYILTARADATPENRELRTVTFDVDSNLADSGFKTQAGSYSLDVRIYDTDKGSVIVTPTGTGTLVTETQSDTYSLSLSKAPTADVVVSVLTDGQTIASSTDPRWDAAQKAIVFTAANWNTPAVITLTKGVVVTSGQPMLKPGIQPQNLADIRGPLFVYGGVGAGADRGIVVGKILPTETDLDLPVVSTPANEDIKTDKLFITNSGSLVDQSGILTDSNLSGFGMSADELTITDGTNAAARIFDAGITYGQFEIVEVLLGQGNDTMTIHSSALGAVTAVHGGGGNDLLQLASVTADKANAGGSDRVLVLYGDTSQDGLRYGMRDGIVNGQGRSFGNGGNDIIDAAAAGGFVIAYGSVGDDTITGSDFNDHLLGGSGDDVIFGLLGNDHIYGDNGLRVDMSTRNSLQSQLISIQMSELGGVGFDSVTGDALAQTGSDRVTDTGGDNVILADFGTITQIAGTNRAFETGALVLVQSDRVDLGGDDSISAANGRDMILGGNGADVITDTAGLAVIFGDAGRIEMSGLDFVQIKTLAGLGGDDTISHLGTGDAYIMGGNGADSITSGSGDDVILGDVGTLDFVLGLRNVLEGVIETLDLGGDDTINADVAADWVIGGSRADSISNSNGNSVLIGDAGRIEMSGLDFVQIKTLAGLGGADTISHLGTGDAYIMGGNGADSITSGSGNDVILGDVGTLDFTAGIRTVLEGVIETLDLGGNDTINADVAADWVIGGSGADSISNSDGASVLIGDAGRIEMSGLDFVQIKTLAGLGGNDVISHLGTGNAYIMGGNGADSITSGSGDDVILGDVGTLDFTAGIRTVLEGVIETLDLGGNDTINADVAADWVIGGSGADSISNSDGASVLIGDAGRIEMSGLDFVQIKTLAGLGGDDTISHLGTGDAYIMGGNGADSITSGSGDDVILGDVGTLDFTAGIRTVLEGVIETLDLGGNDTINADVAADWVIGGSGADSISNSDGASVLIGDAGRIEMSGLDFVQIKTLAGLGGDDTISHLGTGDAYIMGGNGADSITSGSGDDVILGDVGTLDFVAGIRTVLEGVIETLDLGGDDTINADVAADWVIGGSGADSISNSNGTSVLIGDAGRIEMSGLDFVQIKTLAGLGGNDVISHLGTGNAYIMGGNGADSITSGSGDDVILGDVGTLDFTAGIRTVLEGVIETLDLGGNDTINADVAADWVIGGSGADSISNSDGASVLIGDAGRIEMSGLDFVQIKTLAGLGGNDVISHLGTGNAYIMGGNGADSITSGSGDDVILGDVGTLDFTAGIRTVLEGVIETPDLGGNDSISTDTGADWAIGGTGNDLIQHGSGIAVLMGDAGRIEADTNGYFTLAIAAQTNLGGNDTIYGGSDRDIILGGAGKDWIAGGAGSDFMAGDNALVSRVANIGFDLFTFESVSLADGDDDAILGDAGRDFLFGGTGGDRFSTELQDDITIGEFGRIRVQSFSVDNEVVSSFLYLSQSQDHLLQATLALSQGDPEEATVTVEEPARVDVVILPSGGEQPLSLMVANDNEEPVDGVSRFALVEEPILQTQNVLTDGGALPVIETQPDQTGFTGPWDKAIDFAQLLPQTETKVSGGWQMQGWKIAV
jgi:Ca2+-binding RTX toxin-like protein